MPRVLVLSANRPLLFFGFLFLVALFPVRSLAQSPSITDVRNTDNGIDYTGAVAQFVKINGSNFGSTPGTSTVTFNGTAATVTSWSAVSLYTTVPSGATSGNLIVTVGGVASNAKSFTVLARPNVVTLRNTINANDFTGAVGQSVKILGGGFSASPGTITFNGTTATATSWAADTIYTTVPTGATSGNLIITVGGVTNNTISFTVLARPNILTVRNSSNVDITSGAVGTTLKILGGGFGGSGTVTFNGTTATTTSWAVDRIDTTVPSGATSGNLVVTVGGTASNNYSFTVAPIVSGVTPTTGGAGTVVQISGSNFGSSQGGGTVKINGTSVGTATTWGATSIIFTMPAGLSTGNLVVTANSMASSNTSFTVVTDPTIYSAAPTTAGSGDVIQITGCNFGSSQGMTSTVKINGTSVGTTSVWQQGYISFTMPTGLTSGNLAVTVNGVTSNTESFTVTQPSITSISPTSGAPGLHVTITGSYLGSSPGSVTFYNGHSASIYSWNSTQIVAIVPSGVTTGNVVATVGGVQTNGSTFTSVAPPTVSSSVFPEANGAGWQNMNVTVTFTCTAGGLAISSCSSPQVVSSEGVDQTVTGGATDVNGDVAETSVELDIDKTAPTLTITSPADGDSTSSSSITVSGTLSDSRSGTSGVTCNGTSTTLSSGSFSCNISLAVGVNLLVIRGTDIAGNVSAANMHVTRTGSYSTTTSLQVSPAEVNMVVGDTKDFTVVDQDGHVRTDATWEVDDTDLATIPDGNTPTLTAVATGDVTLTATIDSHTADVTVHVLSGTSLADGTVLWSAPSTSGYTVQQVISAKLAPGAPDAYSLEQDDDRRLLVRALTSDGHQMWAKQFAEGLWWEDASPDSTGGVLVGLFNHNASPGDPIHSTVDLDGQTGAEVWESPLGGFGSKAIGADGKIYLPQGANLVVLDGDTGAVLSSYSAPVSEWDCGDGQPHPLLSSWFGPPIIGSDGAVFSTVLEQHFSFSCPGNITSFEQDVSLFRVAPDGSTSLIPYHVDTSLLSGSNFDVLSSTGATLHFCCGAIPTANLGKVIPDGDGGQLVAWAGVAGGGWQVHITHVDSSGGHADFNNLPIGGMVLGEDGVAYTTDGHQLVAFDITDGSSLWTYTASSGNYLNIVASAIEGGLVAKLTDNDGADTVVRFDSEGTPTMDDWSGTYLQYDVQGNWYGTPSSTAYLHQQQAATIQLTNSEWEEPDQAGSSAAIPIMSVTGASQQSDASHTAIGNVLTRIKNALPSFPTCNTWLQNEADTSETGVSVVEAWLSGNSYGHATVRYDTGSGPQIAYQNGAFYGRSQDGVNAISGLSGTTMIVTVNDVGPFFTPKFPYGPHRYPGGDPRTKTAILVHELGHAVLGKTKGMQEDLADDEAGQANNNLVDKMCGGLIAGPSIKNLSPNHGPVTTQVTINGADNGANFGTSRQNSTVTFQSSSGTVEATYNNWSSSQIIVTVPSGATSGNVTIRIGGGETALSASKNFTLE